MNPFKLVQASTSQAHALTKILSNKTAQKILESLEKAKKTESQVAKELSIPISTVHYNMKQLVGAGLVKNDEYSYSQKGREIIHYSLTDQHIVIQTKPSLSIALLQQILPAILIFCLGLFVFEDIFTGISTPEELSQIQASPMMAQMDESNENADMMRSTQMLAQDTDQVREYEPERNIKLVVYSFISALILVLSILVTTVLYNFNQNRS